MVINYQASLRCFVHALPWIQLIAVGNTLPHFLVVIVSYTQVMSGPMFTRVNASVVKCQCPIIFPLEVFHRREV